MAGLLFAGALVTVSPHWTAPAAAAPPGGQSTEDALAQAKRTGVAVAIASATTPTDTLTADPDGRFTLTRTLVPVRKRVGGVWKDLDATLRVNADGTVGPVLSTSDLKLSGGGNRALATMTWKGQSLGLAVPFALPKPTLAGPTATYANVLPDVDLQVTATDQGGFRDVLVVKTPAAAKNPALQRLALPLTTGGLTVRTDGLGALQAVDGGGKPVFTAAPPRMWDATRPVQAAATASKQTPRGKVTVDQATGAPVDSSTAGPGLAAHTAPIGVDVSRGTLTLTPDAKLLNAADTVYPVYIDPSVNPNSSAYATVTSLHSSSSYWNNTPDPDGYLQVGHNSSIHSRTLLNFPINTGTLGGAVISSAKLYLFEMYASDCNARQMNVYAPSATLTSANAKWDSWNSADWGGVVGSLSTQTGYNSSCPNHTGVSADVTGAVVNDVNSGKSLQTFGLRTSNESDLLNYKEFLATGSSAPQLQIEFDHRPGKPSGLSTSPATGCTGTATTVGDGPVSLYAPVSDPDGGNLDVTFTVKKNGAAFKTSTLTGLASGTSAVLVLSESELAAGVTGTAGFTWQVSAKQGELTSDPSDLCGFTFDVTRTGPPIVSRPTAAVMGQPVSISVAKPSTGAAPGAYKYQFNGGAPAQVAANAAGGATITVTPGRFTNVLTVTGLSLGNNIGDTASVDFRATPPATPRADQDLDGDGRADLVTAGGVNGLPSGVWMARGRGAGAVDAAAVNIGVNGAAVNNVPADFNGAQVITGHFAGSGLQDIAAYYPNSGRITVVRGNGDGTPTLNGQQSGVTDKKSLTADALGHAPLQIANAGTASGQASAYPDLIAVAGDTADGYYLNYYAVQGDGLTNFSYPVSLADATPAGGNDWNNWTVSSAVTSTGTWLFLWNKTTGGLYLWKDLAFDPNTQTFAHNQVTFAATFNPGAALTLRAADIIADPGGIPDLWTVNASPNAKAQPYQVTIAGTAGTATALTQQDLVTSAHAWPLNDKGDGTNVTAATDITGGLTATGTSGVTWHQGDLFSPDAAFDGTGALTATTTSGAVKPEEDFTVSAWVKPSEYKGTVFSQNGTHNSTVRLYADPTTSRWALSLATSDGTTSGYDTVSFDYPIQIGVWVHLTAVYQHTHGRMSLYMNAMSGPSAAHGTTVATKGSVAIGDNQDHDARTDRFKGQISGVQTWAAALTHAQVVALSNTGDYALLNSDDTVYPSGTTWRTRGATMTFANGLLTVTETGSGVISKPYGTPGYPNAVLTLQADGNLVIYPDSSRTFGTATWSSGTYGKAGDVYVLQDNGNFVCFDADNQYCWSSDTANPGDPPPPTYPRTGGPAVYNPHDTHVETYLRSSNALGERWTADGVTWSSTGGPAGTVTDGRPVSIFDPVNNTVEVYYNNGGHLYESYRTPDGVWHNNNLLTGTAMAGSPAVLHNPVNNAIEVYFNDGGVLREAWWTQATSWTYTSLNSSISGSPSAMFDGYNNHVEVYYNSGGTLSEQWWSLGLSWTSASLGVTMAGSPSAVYNPTNLNTEVYYATSAGQLNEKWWNGTTGWSGPLGLSATVSQGDPVAVYDPGAHAIEIFFNTSGNLTVKYTSPAGWMGPTAIGSADQMLGSAMPVYNYTIGELEVYFSANGTLAEYAHTNSGWSARTTITGAAVS
ncbi:LamG-like jellyroll fold domain-containing protein [Dactylosporangium sp. NPDC051541]|uniref:LamG-like jellyroll fold domain-containing protein n=1 Tax=Dactylosporangium sp. NPDC051541 TaxID=3363977 RepID=UPI0037A17DD4